MGVFPVFWLWWMNARQFKNVQIQGARLWTGLYVAAVVAAWWISPVFRMRVNQLPWNYSLIAFEVGVWLWIWLLFRLVKLPANVLGFVIWVDMMGMLFGSVRPVLMAPPQHPAALLFLLVPAGVHLLVEPVRRYQERLKSHLPWYSMSRDLHTQEHERVGLEEALQIAEGYWSRAGESHEKTDEEEMAAMTFGFGWKGQFLEFCIRAPDRISCTEDLVRDHVPWFLRPWLGKRMKEEDLTSRDMMIRRIEDFFHRSAGGSRRKQ